MTRSEAARELLARRGKRAPRSLTAFLASRGHELTAPVKVIADLIERSLTEELRVVISMPPRHGKTSTVLHAFAWLLARDPSRVHAFATYAQELANSKSRTARRLALEAGVQFASDAQTVREWRTTRDGGLLATGVGGPLTGQGITGLGVVDDPLKNRQDADSQLIRDRVWEWFTDVFYTRLEPGASVLVLATRWHPDDLSGRLTQDGWESINLPAINDAGEALWPERYPVSRLTNIREQVGEYTWASLYQGEPRPRDSQLFNEPAFYSELPASYRTVIGLDLAYSKTSRADHSAAVIYAVQGDRWHVRHVMRWQDEITGSMARLATLKATYNAPFNVEGNGPQKAIVSLLKAQGFQVTAINRQADKYAEAQSYAQAWNSGRVLLPDTATNDAPWLPAFLDEHRAFTGINDAADDQVDAAVNGFSEKRVPARAPQSSFSTYAL